MYESDKDVASATDEVVEDKSADDTSQTYGCLHYQRKCSLVVRT